MSDEKTTIYISPEEHLTSIRERLELIPARYIILVIPTDTLLSNLAAWKRLRVYVRELRKEVQIVSVSAQVRSFAWNVNFKVSSSLEASPTSKSRPPNRSGRVPGNRSRPTGPLPSRYLEEVLDEPDIWPEDTDMASSIRKAASQADASILEPSEQEDALDVREEIDPSENDFLAGRFMTPPPYLGNDPIDSMDDTLPPRHPTRPLPSKQKRQRSLKPRFSRNDLPGSLPPKGSNTIRQSPYLDETVQT